VYCTPADMRAGRTPNVGGRAVNPQPVQIGDRRAGRPHAVVVVQLFGAVLLLFRLSFLLKSTVFSFSRQGKGVGGRDGRQLAKAAASKVTGHEISLSWGL
jgi:hypothetical protein